MFFLELLRLSKTFLEAEFGHHLKRLNIVNLKKPFDVKNFNLYLLMIFHLNYVV